MNKYSDKLTKVLDQIKVFQPALVDMLEKYVLSDKDSFIRIYNGEWKELDCGQVFTHKDACLFLYKDRLELCAEATIVASIANSITKYDHCAWCHVQIERMADGLRDETSLGLKAEWVLSK